MRKFLCKSLVLLAAICFGTTNVVAQDLKTGTGTVKMTRVNYYEPDLIYGQLDTIFVGYTTAAAQGGTIAGLKQKTDWNVFNVGLLKVDVSSIPGIITKAVLSAKVTGCDTGRNRKSSFGVAYTDSVWSSSLTYNDVKDWVFTDVLNEGKQAGSSTGNTEVFEEIELDITNALSGSTFTGTATIVVFETAAGGASFTEPSVVVEYEPYETTVTKYDFEDGNNIFTDDSRVSSAIAVDEVTNSNVTVFTAANNCQNGYGFAHYDFTDKLNQPANVSVEFDYYNESGSRAILTLGDRLVRMNDGGCTKNTYGSKGAIFRIGSDKNNFFINGTNLPQADGEKESYAYNVDETGDTISVDTIKTIVPGYCNKWLHVSVMANLDARTISWEVMNDTIVLNKGVDSFWQADANELTQIDVFAWINNSMSGKIDNLVITNYKSNAVFADYTVKYVDAEGNEIKEARTANGQAGKFVNLLDSDKAPIVVSDYAGEDGLDGKMKYLYDTDDSETVAIAEDGSAVITVTFKKATIYGAVLNCMIKGASGADARLNMFQGKFFEGDDYKVYPPRGYGKDGKYYFTAPTDPKWNGVTFTFPGSLNSRTIGGVVTYIGQLDYELNENVAYYSDFETLALPVEDEGNGTGLGQLVGTVNSWYSFSGGIFDRFSQGRGIRLDEGSYVYTAPIAQEGTYMVRIYGRNDESATRPAPYALGLRDAEGNVTLFDIAVPDWGSATTGENVVGAAAAEATEEAEAVEAAGIGIPAGMSLVIMNNGGGSKISLDDITLTKVAEYAETPIVVEAPVYTLAGAVKVGEEEQPAFFGNVWDANSEANTMVAGEDGIYTLTFDEVKFEEPCTILYKVVKNHDWNTNWGFDGNNADYVVNTPGAYKVTFFFNPDALLDNGFNVHCVLEALETEVEGDVNGDGEVGIGDIVTITNVMAGIFAEGMDEEGIAALKAAADVNGDGQVGIGDIVAITNIMAGITTEQPAEE